MLSKEWLTSLVAKTATRRQVLKAAWLGGLGTGALYIVGCARSQVEAAKKGVPRETYAETALAMVIADASRCVGCRRCELACSEFNEGRSQPSLSRIKVARNYNFGPKGVQPGFNHAEGIYGNHRVVQDTCRQCPHPVPCQLACPYDAIEIAPRTNARVVNQEKCTGCRTCQRACPWDMTSFDEVIKKATKCHLCNGDPECVKACPAGALSFVRWTDRTKDTPPRIVVPSNIHSPDSVRATCVQCH